MGGLKPSNDAGIIVAKPANRVFDRWLQPFDHDECGKEVADLFGELGVSSRVLGERRALSAPMTLDKLFREPFNRFAVSAAG